MITATLDRESAVSLRSLINPFSNKNTLYESRISGSFEEQLYVEKSRQVHTLLKMLLYNYMRKNSLSKSNKRKSHVCGDCNFVSFY